MMAHRSPDDLTSQASAPVPTPTPKPHTHLGPRHRISHTKSRKGCYTCKSRRVKVIGPKISNHCQQANCTSVMKNGQYAELVRFEAMTAYFQSQLIHVTHHEGHLLLVQRCQNLRGLAFALWILTSQPNRPLLTTV